MSDSAKPSIYVTTVPLTVADRLLNELKNKDFAISQPPYTVFSGKKKGISVTLYQSGKLTVQGKDMEEFIHYFLEPEILGKFDYSYQELNIDKTGRIGIDESGKGDFFGPLCIAGVYASGDDILKLKEIGVKDSKTMTESSIIKIGNKIKTSFVHQIVKINPLKYNELYSQFKNLNRLLAWGHATTIENLVERTQCRNVIIDQFADEHVVETALKRKKMDVELTQRHRGEEDLVVAAASILARLTFVEGLKKIGEEFDMVLPKGASAGTIAAGKKLVERFGEEALEKTGKLHFKTLDAILNK